MVQGRIIKEYTLRGPLPKTSSILTVLLYVTVPNSKGTVQRLNDNLVIL